MDRYILLDIDNCISHDAWRISEINWNHPDPFMRYHDYHLLAPWDLPGNLDLVATPHKIIIVTSRPLMYRRSTVEWLKRHHIRFEHLLMRNNNDHRSSSVVKRDSIQSLWHYGVVRFEQIEIAYDDRPEICLMYERDFGIKAIVRELHSVSAYHNPLTGVNHADGSKAP